MRISLGAAVLLGDLVGSGYVAYTHLDVYKRKANISFNLRKIASGDNLSIGPILRGAAQPVNILTATATVRRIVNMTALTVVEKLMNER